jgi:hypothetical protein
MGAKEDSPLKCARCHGPTVSEVFVDWGSGGGRLSFPGWRCLVCGDITDAVILSHRKTRTKPNLRSPRHRIGTAIEQGPYQP